MTGRTVLGRGLRRGRHRGFAERHWGSAHPARRTLVGTDAGRLLLRRRGEQRGGPAELRDCLSDSETLAELRDVEFLEQVRVEFKQEVTRDLVFCEVSESC
jgi:hypothetical protein